MENLTYDHDETALDGGLIRVYTYTCHKVINGVLCLCKYERHVYGAMESNYMISAKPVKPAKE